jgi:urease accessory protein
VIVRADVTPGVRGRAELQFERRGSRTVLIRSRVDAPMAIVRPFDLPDGGVLLQILSLGPGLCGGDRLTLSVSAGRGTRVVITTTTATRIMTMDPGRYAEQQILLRADDEAVLEYYPCLTIPYPDSAFVQTITAEIGAGARLGLLECWAMGRIARDEYLRFRSIAGRTAIAVEGESLYADALHLEPAAVNLAGAGILSGRRYLATGVWYGAAPNGSPIPSGPADEPLLAFGRSEAGLTYLRVLSRDEPVVDASLEHTFFATLASLGRLARMLPAHFGRYARS